jgi:hypothetical protein
MHEINVWSPKLIMYSEGLLLMKFKSLMPIHRHLYTAREEVEVEVEVDFATDGQSAGSSWCREPLWCPWPDFNFLIFDTFFILHLGRPLWRENGSVFCFPNTQWSESRRIRYHILLSHLRLPQLGGPGPRIYIPQEQCGPVIPPAIGFPFRRPLRLSGLRWRYSNPPP